MLNYTHKQTFFSHPEQVHWQAQQKQYISFYYVSMHDAVG